MLGGCASSPAERPVTVRNLPSLPTYVAAVRPPRITEGTDPKALAGQCLVALDKANGRLSSIPVWYRGVVQDYLRAPL